MFGDPEAAIACLHTIHSCYIACLHVSHLKEDDMVKVNAMINKTECD